MQSAAENTGGEKMAKVVYGVSGEGSGHSSRSREMLMHLHDLGHQVKVVSYDRGYANLKDDFDVFETKGLHIASLDNRVSKVKTFILKSYAAKDNSAIKTRLAELLNDNGALARAFHARRMRLIP
jgi:uncharacterized protein (TIGR00661 family)